MNFGSGKEELSATNKADNYAVGANTIKIIQRWLDFEWRAKRLLLRVGCLVVTFCSGEGEWKGKLLHRGKKGRRK